MSAFDNFVGELRADQRFASTADDFEKGTRELDQAAIFNRDVRSFRDGLLWIVLQARPIEERIIAVNKIFDLPNTHVVIPSMKCFLGW